MTTVNMGLTKPTVGGSSSTWGSDLNSNLDTIDEHDHTSGKGERIPTAAINVNADLPLNEYNLTEVKSVRYENQAAALASGSDNLCLYAYGNNLYWNTSSGTAVQLTAGTSINASGITTNTYTTTSVAGTLTIDPSDTFDLLFVSTAAARTINLPAANSVAAGRRYKIKDITGSAQTYNITLVRNGSDTIEGVSGNKTLQSNWGAWEIVSDGSSAWFMV